MPLEIGLSVGMVKVESMQPIPDDRSREHAPTLLKLATKMDPPQGVEIILLDRDVLMVCVTHGTNMQVFLDSAEQHPDQAPLLWAHNEKYSVSETMYHKLLCAVRSDVADRCPRKAPWNSERYDLCNKDVLGRLRQRRALRAGIQCQQLLWVKAQLQHLSRLRQLLRNKNMGRQEAATGIWG